MDRCLPPLALARFLYLVMGLLSYLCWLEKLLRPVRTRGERCKDRRPKIRICGVTLIILLLLGSIVHRRRILRSPPVTWGAGRLDRRNRFGKNWVQPHHLFYLHHLRSCASSAWGLIERDSSPLQPTDWNSDMGIGSSIAILVQGLYFMTLWIWVLHLGDIMRLLVLGMGTIAWIRDLHFHSHVCRRVSVLGGSWLSSGMENGRVLLLLAIYCYPAFPNTRIFSTLGEGGVSMDIDDSNVGDELMPQAPNQPPVSAVDAELADLFGCDIRDIQEDRCLQASGDRGGILVKHSSVRFRDARGVEVGDPLGVTEMHYGLISTCIVSGSCRASRQPNGCNSSGCGAGGFAVGPSVLVSPPACTPIAGHVIGRLISPILLKPRRTVSLPFMIFSPLPSSLKIIFLRNYGLRYVANMLGCLRLSSRLIVGMLGMLARPGKAAAKARVNSARAGLGLSCLCSLKRSVGRISGDNVAAKP